MVWVLPFVLVLWLFFGGSHLSGRGGKGRGFLEVLLDRLVVLRRARHGGGAGRVFWSLRPRAASSTRCRLLQRRRGALRYVRDGGVLVDPRPAQAWWMLVDGFIVGVPFCRCCYLDPSLRESWRCSFNVLHSVAARRMTPVSEAWCSSPVVVSEWFGTVFSGDGEDVTVVLGRVFPQFVCCYVFPYVLCIF